MKILFKLIFFSVAVLVGPFIYAQGIPIEEYTLENKDAYIFTRDDCSHCKNLKQFIDKNLSVDIDIEYIDIETDNGRELFNTSTEILATGKVTPISFVDGEVFVGFSPEVVGKRLVEIDKKQNRTYYSFATYLGEVDQTKDTAVCGNSILETCSNGEEVSKKLTLPVVGSIDPQKISLGFLALVLGFVDGFNPCAMWVLLTFLLVLSQIGDRKKMIQVAGLFIVAEGIMYYLILNIWYQTWDFIALDSIITPIVGTLALGSGIYFLYKYISGRNKPLTCDVTSLEHQEKTKTRIQKIVSKPMTFMVAIGIIGLALSVNVIEFACSVGIPQAFTKVLEMNNLSFWQNQWYTLVYTLAYMIDDVLVFGLAIWGYKKFYAVGQKYSKLSTLVAGILMIGLGLLLVINPQILLF